MGARELLTELAVAGVAVRVDGGRLLVKPASLLTDDLRAALRAAKPELLTLLAQRERGSYALTAAEGEAAHALPWDDATIARFVTRVALFLRRGISATDADDLGERMHLRDIGADDRVFCVACSHYRPGRCGNYHAAGLESPEVGSELATRVQRCRGFADSGGGAA